jgi:thiopurine S-methyltransferase
MQPAYARQLLKLLPAGAPGLVNCLEYPPEVMEGPPFSINEASLRALLGEGSRVRRISARDINTEGTSLEGRGLAGLAETTYRVRTGA